MEPSLAMRDSARRAPRATSFVLLATLSIVVVIAGESAFGRSPSFGPHGLSPDINPWARSWYIRGEFLSLWAKGNRLPPLLTTSPVGTPQVDAGVLGESGTEILLGEERSDDLGHLGGRLTVGHFLNARQTRAVEVELWTVGEGRTQDTESDSQAIPILARPFFNTQTNQPDSQLVNFPALVVGGIQATVHSEAHSITALAIQTWKQGSTGYIDLFGGYRFFRFRESLEILEELQPSIDVTDNFLTENDFHGVELGGVMGIDLDGWLLHRSMLEVTTKIALGDMRQQLTIDGSTAAGGVTAGGWLTAPSNIGTYTTHEFAAIPTLGVRLSTTSYDAIRLSLGYDLMFVSKVLRAGEQIDTTVNPSQLAPLPLARGGGVPSVTARPAPRMDDTTMWLQGLSFGFELRW